MKNFLAMVVLAALSTPAYASGKIAERKLASDAYCGSITGDVRSTEKNTLVWDLFVQKGNDGNAHNIAIETKPGDANSQLLAIAQARVTVLGNDATVATLTCVDLKSDGSGSASNPVGVRKVSLSVSQSQK